MNKKLLAAGVVIAGALTFAGTCTIQKISLTTIGSNKVFAGAVQNDSGVDILDHNVAVAFIGTTNNLLETKIVQPCLRTLPNGSANYFSAQSSFSASSVSAGLARVNFDSTFKVGTPASGSGTITNLAVNRGTTTLTVSGTFKNTDSTTLTAPNACAVVFNSSGNVVVVGLDQSMGDLSQNASDTFSISLTVPDSTTTVSKVNVYVDGYKDSVPIRPISSTGNTPSLTPTATATPVGTPGAAAKLNILTTIPTATHDVSFGNVQVAIQDANGLTVTSSTANVTLSNLANPAGGVVTCTNVGFPTIAAVSGVATFTNCSIDKGGIGYRLQATSAGLSTDTSNSFNVNAGTAITLTMSVVNPATSGSGQNIVVTQKDVDGTNVWNDTGLITLAILNNAGSGVLTCTGQGTSVTPSNGIATFTGCSISKVGTGYTLRASKAALTADSIAFNIYPVIVFTASPAGSTTASGANFATQPAIQLRNGDGTLVAGDNSTQITLTLNQVSPGPGVLACTANTVTAASGVVTFATCNVTGAGVYTLTASGANLTSVTTTPFTITP